MEVTGSLVEADSASLSSLSFDFEHAKNIVKSDVKIAGCIFFSCDPNVAIVLSEI